MIRINLLPQQKRAKASQAGKEITLCLVALFFVLGGIGGVQYWLYQKENALEQRVEAKAEQKNALFEKIRHLQKQEKQMEDLEERIQAIKIIREAQGGPVQYLDTLVSLLPEDAIWFESLEFSREKGISLRGVALDNQAFAAYVRKLREVPQIAAIQTRRTSRRRIQDFDFVEFQTEIRTKMSEKQDKERG